MSISVNSDLSIPSPQHFPISNMKRFGTTPYGDNQFRVVFAPSVKDTVFGTFADGYVGGRLRPAYRRLENKWIIEKWIPAEEYTKMTSKEYDMHAMRDPGGSGLIVDGPYPSRGKYVVCHVFEFENPTEGSVEKIIRLVQKAKFNDPIKNRQSIEEGLKKQQQEIREGKFLKAREQESLYPLRAASFPGSPKKSAEKTLKTLYAEDYGLPSKHGQVKISKS